MKKLYLIYLFLCCTISSIAQDETARPTYGVDIEREVEYAIIEKNSYHNVIVKLEAADITSLLSGVKITVKDRITGKKIFKRRFYKSYLYGFSDGTLQVGKGNVLVQLVITKSDKYKHLNIWDMVLKEKGIY